MGFSIGTEHSVPTRMLALNLADGLSGRAKLEVIQWLLLSRAPRKALRDQLAGLLSAPATLGPCRLRRARFKPGRKLTAYYDALVHVEGTDGYRPRAIAVTWRSDRDEDQHGGTADLSGIQAEALRQGVAAPFRQLTADLPERSMHLEISPAAARVCGRGRGCSLSARSRRAALRTPAAPRGGRGRVLGARRGGSPRLASPADGSRRSAQAP